MPERHPDEKLVVMARDGDAAAFEELFTRHKGAILNFIYRMIGNRETAEEVTQEVFVSVYRNLAVFDPRKRFLTWLYTIARNLAKNALRDRRYFRDISLEGTAVGGTDNVRLKDAIGDERGRPDRVLEDGELQERAQRALDALPLKLKEVVTLCSIQGLTYAEAAEIIGCSVAGVAVRLEKAKSEFMRLMGMETDKGSE